MSASEGKRAGRIDDPCTAQLKREAKERASLDALLALIKTWVETASGPKKVTLSNPVLNVRVKIRGYKKIILERTPDE